MVLLLEHFNLEDLATKNTTKILRHMILHPYLTFGLSELALELQMSKSNVLRILNVLIENNLVIEIKSGRKKLFHINSELELIKDYWKLFMTEKKYNLPSDIKNTLDLFYSKVKDDVELFIVFGSVAQGLSTPGSDIDISVVSKRDLNIHRFDFLPYRLEIQHYSWQEVENPGDFVILESLMHGIVYKGNVFPIISEIKSFPKDYLIYRLEKARGFLKKGESYNDEARTYFRQMAETTLGEVKSILDEGKTIPKKEIRLNDLRSEINILENKISRQGEKVWLI